MIAKVKRTEAQYKALALKLKRQKIVSFDLRKKLTASQKSSITKNYKKYRDIIDFPNEFVKRYVSKKTINEFKKAKIYTILNNKVYIPKNGYEDIKIGNYFGKKAIIRTMPLKTRGQQKKVIDIIDSQKNILKNEDFLRGKLPPNSDITARIGDNSPFIQGYSSVRELLAYINTTFTQDLISQISLVIVPRTK